MLLAFKELLLSLVDSLIRGQYHPHNLGLVGTCLTPLLVMKTSDVSLSTFTRPRVLEIVVRHRFISLSGIPKRSSDLSMLSYACLKSMKRWCVVLLLICLNVSI